MKVFYNPVMSLNRDFSVLLFTCMNGVRKSLDGLAASGVRGIRIKNESEYDGEMHLNDHSPSAVELMKQNAELNQVEVVFHNENLNTLLSDNYYDYIDIDPFGSPVNFIPLAFGAIRNGGVLAITATDTGALCGSYPKPALRRYGFRNIRGPVMHESGIRGLLGYLIMQAAAHDRYIEPIMSQSLNHFYRIHIRVRNGARKADAMIKEMGHLVLTDIGQWMIDPCDGPPNDHHRGVTGPFYFGSLHEKNIIDRMRNQIQNVPLHNRAQVIKYLDIYCNEANAPPFYYDTDRISSFLKRSTPALNTVLEALNKKGFSAVKTQFSSTGFKSDADERTLLQIYSKLGM